MTSLVMGPGLGGKLRWKERGFTGKFSKRGWLAGPGRACPPAASWSQAGELLVERPTEGG